MDADLLRYLEGMEKRLCEHFGGRTHDLEEHLCEHFGRRMRDTE